MTVVAAYSPSAQGDAALAAAVREAKLLQADLLIASHFFNDPTYGPRSADRNQVNDALNRLSRTFTHDERTYLETLELKVETSVSEDIGAFVIDTAINHSAKLIVIGLRHASVASKMSLGVAVRKILTTSPCPVLAAKA